MNRKIILWSFLGLLMAGVLYLTVYPQVQGTPPLRMPETYTNIVPAHELNPPFPYVYHYIGQAFLSMGLLETPGSYTHRGYPAWAMDDDDTASSNIYRFPEGVDKAYLSGIILEDTNTACSSYYNFSLETRLREADFDALFGTLAKGWYQIGTNLVNGEAAGCGRIDTLTRTLMTFPSKALGDEWKICCTTNNADHMNGFTGLVIAGCQVTFGFAGDKQYFVQYYPDPSQGDEVGGKLFQSTGVTGADTTLTCRAPAFSTFTVWAHPLTEGDSLKAYVVVEAKALRGLFDDTDWYALDSVYLNGAADSVGETVIIPSATKGFFSEYRIRTNPLKRASGNDSTTTLQLEIFGVFSP